MALSLSLRKALGDSSLYVRGQLGAKSSVQTQIENARTRLNAIGEYPEQKNSQNFLLKVLDIISRPGHGATGLIREFTNPQAGSTPGEFDPLGAFWRGLKGEEKFTGKDVFMDVGLSGDEGVFGGEAKWYNPSPAGALGLVLDIFNPLDPLNWLGFGVGDDIIKGASRGLKALIDAFGATKAAQIADILTASAKVADTVGDVARAAKAADTVGDIAKGVKAVDTAGDAARAAKATASVLDDLGAETVGKLVAQITSKVDDVDSLRRISELIQEGLAETGKTATSRLNYSVSKPLTIGLQNPLSITPIGSVKLPGYKATGGRARLPIIAPGKDIAGTFINIPGSEYVTKIVGQIAKKIASTDIGQALGKMFSTVFVPANVPASVVTKSMTASNIDDLVALSKTSPANIPLSIEELLSLQDDLAKIKLGKTFDFADDFSATELKLLNKGEYFSVEDLAKKVGLKDFTTDEVLTILAQAPFTKNITELYDDLRLLKPTAEAKELFVNAAKIRKVMDLLYEQIPEGAKPFFRGVIRSQLSDLYPSEITTSRLGKNVATSPLMAYEFDYKGVPVSVVVNSGENFNVNAWAKLSATFEALDELPETAIQALKGQIDISPIPIKSPDTSMTIGDTIVLGRIDKPTVAHEFGHIWDAVAGDQNAYTQAILSDARRFDNTITPDDLYSDYARSIYASDKTIGLKEDFADSVSDYLRDRSSFHSQYPGRAAEIERVLDQVSIPQEELAKLIAEQRKLAEQVSQIPRTEAQIKAMIDSVDKYAQKFTIEAGDKTYQAFRKNLAALYEQTNWKTKQWQQQVEELFRGLTADERKQIMDAAAQITGTEIPGRAKTMAQPVFAEMTSQSDNLKYNQITREWKKTWEPYYTVKQKMLEPGEMDINAQRTFTGAEPGRYRVPTDETANKYPRHSFDIIDKNTGEVVANIETRRANPPTHTEVMRKAFQQNPELATKYGIAPEPELKPLRPLFADNPNQAHLFRLRDAKEVSYTDAHPRYGYFFTESLDDLEGWKYEILDNWMDDTSAEIVEGLYDITIKDWDSAEHQRAVYDRLLEAGLNPEKWVLENTDKTVVEIRGVEALVEDFKERFYDGYVTIKEVLDMMKSVDIPDELASKILGGQAFRSNLNDDFASEVFVLGKPKAIKEGIHQLPQGTDVDWNEISFPQSIKPLFAQQDFPVFASKLQEVVDRMPNKMSVDQFKNYLKNKGVKAEELKWTFMDDFFEGKTSITKAEAQQWVRGNQLEVKEVWRKSSGKTKLGGNIDEIAADLQTRTGIDPEDFRYAVERVGENLDDATIQDTIETLLLDYEEADWDTVENALRRAVGQIEDPGDTKFSRYTQPGGQDYMELEFILPEDYAQPKRGVTGDIDSLKMEYEELASRIDDIREELGMESQEFITMNRRLQELEAQGVATPVVSPQFQSVHWEEPNVVAHARFDTRYTEDGKKILFIDEVQSDWHQTGRDKGYLELGKNKHDLFREERDKLVLKRLEILDDNGPYGHLSWDEKMAEMRKLDERIAELEKNFDYRVPDAPFRNSWDEYVQKRLLRYAADNGYDGIAWSTGIQQAERWQQAVTEAIDTLQYNQTSHSLRAYKGGEEVLNQTVEPQKLAEMVGADNARKLLNTEPDTFSVRPVDGSQGAPQGYQVVDQNGNAWGWTYPSQEAAQKAIDDLISTGQTVKTVSGTNVTIGAEGMRKFYDQQFRSNMNKLGKRFGLKVEEIPLEFAGIQSKDVLFTQPPEPQNAFRYFFEGDTEGVTGHPKEFIEFNIDENDVDIANLTADSFLEEIGRFDDTLRIADEQSVNNYVRAAREVAEQYGIPLSIEHERRLRQSLMNRVQDPVNVLEWFDETGENIITSYTRNANVISLQPGIWLNTDARRKIIQQSFPLFADNTKAPVDDLTAGWSERQINALDNFLKWRNSVVKQYRQIGIPINELEKYVPFIPLRPLKKDEADLLRSVFGTGVREATADNFDTLLTELSKADPNLKARTTKATRPSQVNKMLNKPWLTEDAAVAMSIRGARAIKAQELNSFVDEFIQTYGLRAGDLSQIAGNTVPDGYAAYKLGVDQAGNKVLQQVTNVPRAAIEGTDIVFLPQEMANLYNEYHKLMFNQTKQNGLLRVYDELSALYKKAAYLWNPGHLMRDFQGNVFNNYLMGVVDPMEYADGLKALRRADGVLQTPRGDLPFSEIYEQAQKMGIIDSAIGHEVPLSTTKAEGAYSRIMRQATYATDGWTRMTGFVHNLKAGQDYAQAAATTKKFLFDYFDLTAFEKKVMRRVIPFYTWMRKNIPLQFKSLITDPRIFARLNDIQNAIAGDPIDWEEKPDYIQDMMAIQPMGSDKYFSNTLPWQDLTRIPTGVNSRSLSDLLSSVSPLIRAPIESITNTNWWTGQPLEDYAGEQTDIPVLTTLLRLLGSDTDYTVGARYGGHLLNQIPILTRAGGLLDAVTGQETNDARILSRVSTTLGGPSVYNASSVENSADWQELQRLVDLIRLLQDQGVEVPTINELKETSRYQRLKRILGGR